MFKTLDICPSSIQGDPQVQAACESIDQELQQIYGCIPSICFWPNIANQTSPLLDILMWEMHVDQWEIWSQEGGGLAPLTDAQKRYLIDNSVDWHAHKGTKWICDQMLQQVFKDGEVVEWYNYGGLPYHFQVITRDANVDPVKQQQMIDAIMSVKNVRSWPDGFIRDRYFSDSGNLNVGSCVVQFINTYIKAIK